MNEPTAEVLTRFYKGKSLRALQKVRRTRKAELARATAAAHVFPVKRCYLDYARADVALIESVIERKRA